jgi:hypothetical protein
MSRSLFGGQQGAGHSQGRLTQGFGQPVRDVNLVWRE